MDYLSYLLLRSFLVQEDVCESKSNTVAWHIAKQFLMKIG